VNAPTSPSTGVIDVVRSLRSANVTPPPSEAPQAITRIKRLVRKLRLAVLVTVDLLFPAVVGANAS
jgi:hypothetical protein